MATTKKNDAPTTLRSHVVDRLRAAIIDGTFEPGARLVERHMCEFLEVSRTLVRESLRQLEAEGWVRILPNRGPFVVKLTSEEVRELYEVRAALEGVVAQRAAERASPGHVSALDKVVAAMKSAQMSGDTDRHRKEVHDFYEILRTASGNRLLHAQLSAMSERMAWLRGFTLSRPDRAAAAVQDEIRLLEAIRARDGTRARSLCETQIKATGEAVVTAWQA